MYIRRICNVLLFLIAFALPSGAYAATPTGLRVLFVGNSLTYVGNLPAVFTTLANDNGHAAQAGMLVKGGATLTEWLDGGAIQRALKASHYNFVVMQERGNDFACGFGPQACRDSRQSLQTLARIVRTGGAKPILMGTYQVDDEASTALVAAESRAADANGMPYIAVSPRLNEGRKQFAHFDWFAKAGHPGHDLVLLEAVMLYRQLYGALPRANALTVRAPMFVPGSQFAPPAPLSMPLLPAISLAGGYEYAPNEVEAVIGLVR